MTRTTFKLAPVILLAFAIFLVPKISFAGTWFLTYCGTAVPECDLYDEACESEQSKILLECYNNSVCESCIDFCHLRGDAAKLTPKKTLNKVALNEYTGAPDEFNPCAGCLSWNSFPTSKSEESFCTGKETTDDTGGGSNETGGEQTGGDDKTENTENETDNNTADVMPAVQILTTSHDDHSDNDNDREHHKHRDHKENNHKRVLPATGNESSIILILSIISLTLTSRLALTLRKAK